MLYCKQFVDRVVTPSRTNAFCEWIPWKTALHASARHNPLHFELHFHVCPLGGRRCQMRRASFDLGPPSPGQARPEMVPETSVKQTQHAETSGRVVPTTLHPIIRRSRSSSDECHDECHLFAHPSISWPSFDSARNATRQKPGNTLGFNRLKLVSLERQVHASPFDPNHCLSHSPQLVRRRLNGE